MGRILLYQYRKTERIRAVNLLKEAISKKKVTVHFIQKLTGTLNFLNRAIVPGRAFTRGMYDRLKVKNSKGIPLKQYHHVNLDSQFIADCQMWLSFLADIENDRLCRPFLDFDAQQPSRVLSLYSDASKNKIFGMGAIFENRRWIQYQWPLGFIEQENPSIEYLELFALVSAVVTWSEEELTLQGGRVTMFLR